MWNQIAQVERDLRGSVGTIVGYAQVLDASGLDDAQSSALHEIRGAADHLLGELEMLFEYWRLEWDVRPQPQPQPFELTGAAMTAADLVSPHAASRDIHVAFPREVEPGNWVLADEQLVLIALTRAARLLVDSLDGGGRLEFRLASGREEAMRVALEVEGLAADRPPLTPTARALLDSHVRAAGGRFESARVEGHGHLAIDLPRAQSA